MIPEDKFKKWNSDLPVVNPYTGEKVQWMDEKTAAKRRKKIKI